MVSSYLIIYVIYHLGVLRETIIEYHFHRFCSILFDEVCLSSGLSYDSVTDQIDGFVDTGSYKSQNIADHALGLYNTYGPRNLKKIQTTNSLLFLQRSNHTA